MKVGRDIKGDNVSKSGTEASGTESGVMFPRLNVKETKKDGPRAPPRNKMALYEQFTIPSNRFFQPTQAAPPPRQNPTPLINQPVSCDGRFMYTPYYVSPHVYPTVSFLGQFLGQNVMSCTNNTATESHKSTECDVAKSAEQSARVANYSNARDRKVQCNQNPFSSQKNHVEELTSQASRKLNNSDVPDGVTLGGSHLQKKGQKSSNPTIGCISENLRTVPLQVGSRLKYRVQQSLSPVIQSDGTGPKLCKDGSQYPCGDAYCVEEGPRFEKCPNEGPKSRVEYEDHYYCKTKTSGMSDDIAISKGINLCSSIRQFQAYVEKSHGAKEPLKTVPACVESQYSVENLSRDLDKDTEGCQNDEQRNEEESLKDQANSSDHNSDSSMVDSLHAFEITPKTVISAIGQKEFWRVRKAILRQQKIFSTQVFELHRLVKVQKLIAMPSNLLIEDNMYKSSLIVISEEQCVPTIKPEKCPKTFEALVHNDSEIATDKGKPCNKAMPTQSSISTHPSARGSVELIAHDKRDRSHPPTFTVGTFAPGSASTWGYPAYLQNLCAVPARPGCYGYYQQYPLNQMGVSNAVMGIPCSLEGNCVGSRNVHGCQHQCSAEHQANVQGHFPKYPSQDGLCYNSPTAPVPFELFRSAGKACYPYSDAGRSVGNESVEEMSAGSFRSESVLKQSKQVRNVSVDKSSNEYHSQDSASQVSVGQDNQGLSQTEHLGLHSKNRNAACHPSASLSEHKMNNTDMQEKSFNSLNWIHSEDAHVYECPSPKESNEDVADVPDVADLENQGLSLLPVSSSFSWSSKTVKDKSLFSSKEQRVRVIKAVPRTATAASESTADILLSLQRERQQ